MSEESILAPEVENCQFSGEGSVSEPTNANKSTPYIPPRIDDHLYQTSIPDLVALPKVDTEALRKSSLVYTTNHREPVVQDFLQRVRAILKNFSVADYGSDWMCESDSMALEYLHKFQNNAQQALFFLEVDLCCGKDLSLTQQTIGFLEKTPTNCAFQEYKDRLLKNGNKGVVGSYPLSRDIGVLFDEKSSLHKLPTNFEAKYAFLGEVSEENLKFDENPFENEEFLHESDAKDKMNNLSGGRGSSRHLAQEKVEIKKKWQAVIITAAKIGGGGLRSAGRSKYREAIALLEDALSISMPFTVALTSAGSAAQASEDYAAIENARVVLGELVKKIYSTRLWVAKVRDTLFRKRISGIIVDPVTRTDTIRMEDLQSLLNEGKKLELVAEDEEQQLQVVIELSQRFCEEVQTFLSNVKVSPLFPDFLGTSKAKEVYSCPYRPEDIESMVCAQMQRVLPKFSMEQTLVALQSLENMYEGLPSSDDANVTVEGSLLQGKVSMETLRSLAQQAHLYKCKLNELPLVDEILVTAEGLSKKVVAITTSFFYQRDKAKIDANRKRFDWQKVVKLYQLVTRYPLSLSGADGLQQMVTIVQNWRSEVQRLGFDVESKSNTGSKRNPRSSAKKDSKSLPLKRIEVLLFEGDRFPFSFPQEMSILREQREQAKLLIKKLRESLESTRRKNKNRSGGEEDNGGGNKMVYSEFKHLLMEGESFYLGGDDVGDERVGVGSRAVQKDLDRAQSVMEIAEEWLANVREMITSHFDYESKLTTPTTATLETNESEADGTEAGVSIEDVLIRKRIELADSLKEQLGEADSLPFTLEEADVVRFQLQAIEWAVKSRPWLINIDSSLGSKALPRYVDAVQMRDEIFKIRNSMNQIDVDGLEIVPLKEEEVCVDLVKRAADISDRLKKCIQGKEVKNGTSLEKLKALVSDASALNVNFDYELRPIKSAIAAAETWISEHKEVLQNTGLLKEAKKKSEDSTGDDIMDISDETKGSYSLEVLEQLQVTANQLSAVFPALIALRQRISDCSAWVNKTHEFLERAACFVKMLQFHEVPLTKIPAVMGFVGHIVKRRKDSADVEENFQLIPIADFDAFIQEGCSFGLDLKDSIAFLTSFKSLVMEWSGVVQTLLSTKFVEFAEEIDITYRQFLASCPRSLGIPFLETLTDPAEPLVGTADELLLRNRKLDEMLDIANLLQYEGKTFSVSTSGTALVAVTREVLQMVKTSFNLVVFGVDQQRVISQNPQLIHWGDVDVHLLQTVKRKLLGLWEIYCEDDSKEPSTLLRGTVLRSCVPSSAEDVTAGEDQADKEDYEQHHGDTMEESDQVDGPKSKTTRLSSGIVKKRLEDDYTDSSRMNLSHINSSVSKRKATADVPPEKSRTGRDTGKKDEVEEYLKAMRKFKKATTLSPSFVSLLEFWIQLLVAFESRVTACSEWRSRVQNCLRSINSKSGQALGEVLQQLLKEAIANGFRCDERIQAENVLLSSDLWLRKARGMLAREESCMLTAEELKEFIKDADKVILEHNEELGKLRTEQRRARNWKQKLDSFQQGGGAGQGEFFEELKREAGTLCVNVQEEIDSIEQASRLYCLCRQLYFGRMVGCDSCDDWYHLTCVGLSEGQADKSESYICIRCSIRNSFVQAVHSTAQTANKWMIPEEHFRSRDNAVSRITRKIIKESTDIEKLEKDPALQDYLQRAAEAVAQGAAEPIAAGDITGKLKELEQSRFILKRSQAELERVQLIRNVERCKLANIMTWMEDIQNLLWPEDNLAMIALGAPLTPSTPDEVSSHAGLNFQEYPAGMRNVSRLVENPLPIGLKQLANAAEATGIAEVEDVMVVLDSFRWMSWCNLALHLLRFPAPTPLLRKVVECGKAIKCADEKIVKVLLHVAGKASSWKEKARKLVSHSKKMDEGKVASIVIDGNNLPFTSRMKRIFQQTYDQIKSNGEGTNTTAKSEGEPESKRPRLEKSSKVTASKLIPEDVPYSSEEENGVDVANPSASSYCLFSYDNSVNQYLASSPNLPWPLPITVCRRVKRQIL